jgi:hypothetical protein
MRYYVLPLYLFTIINTIYSMEEVPPKKADHMLFIIEKDYVVMFKKKVLNCKITSDQLGTYLVHACTHNSFNCAKLLLKLGAPANYMDTCLGTPLACSYNKLEMTCLLRTYNANPLIPSPGIFHDNQLSASRRVYRMLMDEEVTQEDQKKNLLNIYTSMHAASSYSESLLKKIKSEKTIDEQIDRAIKHGNNPHTYLLIESLNGSARPLLMPQWLNMALETNNKPLMHYLISHGAEPLAQFLLAVSKRDVQKITLLLAYVTNPLSGSTTIEHYLDANGRTDFEENGENCWRNQNNAAEKIHLFCLKDVQVKNILSNYRVETVKIVTNNKPMLSFLQHRELGYHSKLQ